jgi:uncharacterized repeat protein (TIGR03833 family)
MWKVPLGKGRLFFFFSRRFSLLKSNASAGDSQSTKVMMMEGKNRINIKPGIEVSIVLKENQRTGKLTDGRVQDILTKSPFHPHGIKVRLTTGEVGRVQVVK